jgi:hypothetical protein
MLRRDSATGRIMEWPIVHIIRRHKYGDQWGKKEVKAKPPTLFTKKADVIKLAMHLQPKVFAKIRAKSDSLKRLPGSNGYEYEVSFKRKALPRNLRRYVKKGCASVTVRMRFSYAPLRKLGNPDAVLASKRVRITSMYPNC